MLHLFEERARSQPDAIAVSFAGRRVTYANLDERAEQIACGMREAGVGPETVVALYLDRSPDLVASLLGVWKAGGAYLPIDPTNPRQRVAFTLEDSQAPYVLTERSLLSSLPSTSARVLCVEDLCSNSLLQVPTNTPFSTADVPLNRLAYVIYTSGSTGKPKGAGVEHGGLANVVGVIGEDIALQPADVALATATIAFDISNLEILLPLVAGATLHLMERHFTGDGRKLIDLIRVTSAALVFGTPTSWRLMLEAGWKGSPRLQIITGGEVLPLSLAHALSGKIRALWNHYGPTETSICATRERVLPEAEIITLGRPITNVHIYVLDPKLRPVQGGETGEIYIGGAGVGRGYRNRPDLTERAFLADPFQSEPGARMYKTGDLGSLLPDGRLDFHGRADNQIKLRGFRIELEEIEAAIRECPGVHAASVQLVDYGVDDQRLVAYFLGDGQATPASLRDFLRQRMPFYMLPSEIVPLKSLPMTVNGKIDKQALDAVRLEFEARTMADHIPHTASDLEARLTAIWQKLLKVRHIGPLDNFFDLGGHSLLAIRMFSEVEKLTGRKIPLSILIQNPSVSELAAYIRSRPEIDWPGLVTMRDQGNSPPLFIAHGLGSNLLLFRDLAEELGSDQPVYGIQLAAPADAHLEQLSLGAFAQRYVEEICSIDPVGPYYLAGHSLGGLLVFEIASQLRRLGKEIGLLALLDCKFRAAPGADESQSRPPASLRENLVVWKKKFGRLFSNGMVITVWRKILYQQLMLKLLALRHTHREGSYRPNFFGVDPYIALLAEGYRPSPIEEDAVLFVAEDELAPESLALGWAQVIKGQLEVQKIPGSHQTIFTQPQVAVLAGQLGKRLTQSAQSVHPKSAFLGREASGPQMNPLLECHGD